MHRMTNEIKSTSAFKINEDEDAINSEKILNTCFDSSWRLGFTGHVML